MTALLRFVAGNVWLTTFFLTAILWALSPITSAIFRPGCRAKLDGSFCQLGHNHEGLHQRRANYGTRGVFVHQWHDPNFQGVSDG